VNNSSKKDREEVDGLKREISLMVDDFKAKETKLKGQHDRLKK
jgi:hypothetical protein